MKRYKLTKGLNPETHAFIENDKEYADCLNNPSKHIMDMYNSLDEFDKKMIEQSLIQKYRNECMYQYFR